MPTIPDAHVQLYRQAAPTGPSVCRALLPPQSRSYEVANSIERILAAVIRSQPKAKAEDFLRWLANAGFEEDEDPHEAIRYAIRDWVKLRPGRAGKLFWALFKQSPDRAYHAPLA